VIERTCKEEGDGLLYLFPHGPTFAIAAQLPMLLVRGGGGEGAAAESLLDHDDVLHYIETGIQLKEHERSGLFRHSCSQVSFDTSASLF
jgi:hypothetical protein